MPALRNSVQLEHRLKQEGLGLMLVGEGGTAGEGGGASPSSCGILQLVGVLGRDRCVGHDTDPDISVTLTCTTADTANRSAVGGTARSTFH